MLYFKMKRAFILTILVCLTSCSEKLLEKPQNLIARDKMVEVLKDLAKVNAAKTTNAAILRDNNIDPMAYIFVKHGIDSIQFVESDKYYASLPIEYERIYREVESILEKEQAIFNEAKAVEDSLRLQKKEQKQERLKKQKTTDSLAQTSGNIKQ